MKRVCFSNIKGGVGKTTTCFNVAGVLAQAGYKVLCLDIDPQGNFSDDLFGDDYPVGINELILGKATLQQVLSQPYPEHEYLRNIWAITADVSLFYIEDNDPNFESEYVMKLNYLLKDIENDFDYCLIDTNPSPSLLTNAMAYSYSDYIIGVLDISKHSIKGFEYLKSIIKDTQQIVNPNLQILGIIINNTDKRTNFSNDIIKTINELYGDLVFSTNISTIVKIKEASVYSLPIVSYDAVGAARLQYTDLVGNIVNRINLKR